MNNTSTFWVIFDTCTRRHYYQDVHNLLAYPAGSTIRYEYRDEWLSSEALRASSNPKTAPATILLVYAQCNEYKKGDSTPPSSSPGDEILWVATRFAELQHVHAEAGNNFFDFKALAYPKQDNDSLMKILHPLIDKQETPFHKWVVMSDDLNALNSLQRGNDAENWRSIVEFLSEPPMQFAGDSFWRLKGCYRGRLGSLIQSTYIEEKISSGESIEVRKVTSLHDLSEGDTVGIEFISHTPRYIDDRGISRTGQIRVTYDEDGPLDLITAPNFDIRSYRNEIVKLRAQYSEKLDERSAMIQFATSPSESDWPTGPQITLQFRVNKKGWQLFLSIGFLFFSGILIFSAGKIWENNFGLALLAAVIGFLLLIAKELIISRSIPTKL